MAGDKFSRKQKQAYATIHGMVLVTEETIRLLTANLLLLLRDLSTMYRPLLLPGRRGAPPNLLIIPMERSPAFMHDSCIFAYVPFAATAEGGRSRPLLLHTVACTSHEQSRIHFPTVPLAAA